MGLSFGEKDSSFSVQNQAFVAKSHAEAWQDILFFMTAPLYTTMLIPEWQFLVYLTRSIQLWQWTTHLLDDHQLSEAAESPVRTFQHQDAFRQAAGASPSSSISPCEQPQSHASPPVSIRGSEEGRTMHVYCSCLQYHVGILETLWHFSQQRQ